MHTFVEPAVARVPVEPDLRRAPGLPDYLDPDAHLVERRRVFDPARAGLFLGRSVGVAPGGHRRAEADGRLLLTRSADGRAGALVNLCPHALRPLCDDGADVGRARITCPYHQWSFRLDGSFIGAPSWQPCPAEREETALTAFPVVEWHGLAFTAGAGNPSFAADLALVEQAFADRGIADWLDFDDWVEVGADDEDYRGNWKIFLEVYGDCYHVPPYHPGLASFADCTRLEWSVGRQVHLQFVPRSPRHGSASPRYAAWHRGLEQYHRLRGDAVRPWATAWAAFYPGLMVEYYNGLRVISTVEATGPTGYLNRVRYFVAPDMEALVPGLPAAIRAAYDETAVEDRALVERRHDGIVVASELGLDVPTYRPVLSGTAPELGTAHFHAWWADRTAPRSGGLNPSGRRVDVPPQSSSSVSLSLPASASASASGSS